MEVSSRELKGLARRPGPSKLSWSPDQSTLAVATLAGGVWLLDERCTVIPKGSFGMWEAPVVGAAWSGQNNLVCAHEDGHVKVYPVHPGEGCAPATHASSGDQLLATGVQRGSVGEVMVCNAPQ